MAEKRYKCNITWKTYRGEHTDFVNATPKQLENYRKLYPGTTVNSMEPIPVYEEEADPAVLFNVTDHIKVVMHGFPYVLGVTKREKAVAINCNKKNVCPVLVARIKFRNGARWYWIHATQHTEWAGGTRPKHWLERKEWEGAKPYTRYRIRNTPIRNKKITAYLDKEYPNGIAERVIPNSTYATLVRGI